MVNIEKRLKKLNETKLRKVYCKIKNISKTSFKKNEIISKLLEPFQKKYRMDPDNKIILMEQEIIKRANNNGIEYDNIIEFAKKMIKDIYKYSHNLKSQNPKFIKYKNLIFDKFLGFGSVGLVLQFINDNGKKFAIKGIYIKRYYKILQHMKYSVSYINKYIDKCNSKNSKVILKYEIFMDEYIISEVLYYNLDDYLLTKLPQEEKLEKSMIQNEIVKQLIGGLLCLHKIGITHGDIKPENIFINPEHYDEDLFVPLQIKFADFDGSGIWDKFAHMNQKHQRMITMTPGYMPFGTVVEEHRWGKFEYDIFALGIIIMLIYNYNIGDNFYMSNTLSWKNPGGCIGKTCFFLRQFDPGVEKMIWKNLVYDQTMDDMKNSNDFPLVWQILLPRMLQIDKSAIPSIDEIKKIYDESIFFDTNE